MSVRLGMLTPSSNTVLEPVTAAMLADLAPADLAPANLARADLAPAGGASPDVSAHFARFRVTRIGLADADDAQFAQPAILAAADLLADAKVDAIAWNGTSASWLGFERDERLRDAITAGTGIAACTAVLAFRDVFAATGVRRVGLVTPYTGDVQARIAANWGAAGFPCAAERHFGLSDNFSFATVDAATIADAVRAVAPTCDAVAIVCTNLNGASLAADLEREVGRPVYDSIAVTLWASLRLAGVDARRLGRWGELFRSAALNRPSRTGVPPSS